MDAVNISAYQYMKWVESGQQKVNYSSFAASCYSIFVILGDWCAEVGYSSSLNTSPLDFV